MKKLVSFSLLALALSGCASNTLDQHVQSVGKMGDISIVDMRSQTPTSGGLLVAQTTFHNGSNSVKTGFYRCQFFDANQMALGDPQVWQQVSIYPNEDQIVRCMATQKEATDFKVEFSADGQNVSVYQYK